MRPGEHANDNCRYAESKAQTGRFRGAAHFLVWGGGVTGTEGNTLALLRSVAFWNKYRYFPRANRLRYDGKNPSQSGRATVFKARLPPKSAKVCEKVRRQPRALSKCDALRIIAVLRVSIEIGMRGGKIRV